MDDSETLETMTSEDLAAVGALPQGVMTEAALEWAAEVVDGEVLEKYRIKETDAPLLEAPPEVEKILTKAEEKEQDRLDEITQTKLCRVDIDGILQTVKALKRSRHTVLAINHLEDANMRLGLNLKELGEQDPYPNSRKPENAIVDPTAQGLKY